MATPINAYQRAALAAYADGDLQPFLEAATGQEDLIQRLEADYDDVMPVFLVKELASATDTSDALTRLEDAMQELSQSADAVLRTALPAAA
ncbi:hypothetical protein [Erythrobacter aureus]|uniref:Uncharacterized protein n=1 Tax=Erythrobacter aureus TaxID=2182384 RepID=A0A345YJM6_9SPHN|nr:hypothetical protein [Erythrobacter aureus]AXK44128.1 hypothetical protein DVR09_16885 [Erythrobacter aureus]